MRLIIAFALCLVSVGIVNAQLKPPPEPVMDRFLRYVKIDTQSQEEKLQEHEGSLEEISGVDGERDGSSKTCRTEAISETDSRRNGWIKFDFPGTADAKSFYWRRKFSRKVGVQLAQGTGKDDRDARQPGPDLC